LHPQPIGEQVVDQAALDVGEYHGWQKYTMVGGDVCLVVRSKRFSAAMKSRH